MITCEGINAEMFRKRMREAHNFGFSCGIFVGLLFGTMFGLILSLVL